MLCLLDGVSFLDSIPSFLEACTLYRIPRDEDVLARRLINKNNSFRRIDVETTVELFEILSPTHEHWRHGDWFFRGVPVASWQLVPALFRISWDMWRDSASRYHSLYLTWLARHDPLLRGGARLPDDSSGVRADTLAYRMVEWSMLRDFLYAANLNGFPVPDFDYWWTTAKTDKELDEGLEEFGRWPIDRICHQLAFAQHHNVPTRMLDWSSSSYSASWFAVSNAVEALWKHQIGEKGICYSVEDDARFSIWAINASGNELASADGASLDVVRPGYQLNARINAQKGLFTLLRANTNCLSYGVEKLGHDVFIKERVTSNQPLLVQVTAPHETAPAVLEALARHGVMRSTIYPGVDQVHASFTDLDRAAGLKGMQWLRDPKKHYIPHSAKPLPFIFSEETLKRVEESRRPDESITEAFFRLLQQGLESEAAARGRPSPARSSKAKVSRKSK